MKDSSSWALDAGGGLPMATSLVSLWWHALSSLRLDCLGLDLLLRFSQRTKGEVCRIADRDMNVRRSSLTAGLNGKHVVEVVAFAHLLKCPLVLILVLRSFLLRTVPICQQI